MTLNVLCCLLGCAGLPALTLPTQNHVQSFEAWCNIHVKQVLTGAFAVVKLAVHFQ